MFQSANWICGASTAPADYYTEYDLPFTIQEGKTYTLSLACDTDYALYDGETLLAFGQYADYPDYRVYDTVTLPVMPAGKKTLSLVVWYQGVDSQTYMKKPSGVIFTLTEDGEPILVSSSAILSREAAGYVAGNCRKITGQLGLTFAYDAEKAAGAWEPSHVAEGSRNLVPRPVKKLTLEDRSASAVVQSGGFVLRDGKNLGQVMQNAALTVYTNHAVLTGEGTVILSVREGEDGVYVILDMGRETAGFVDLDFAVSVPCRVIGGWGEHLADGRCRTGMRDFSFEYHAKGGENRFLHPFRRLGGRYLQLFFETDTVSLTYAGIRETAYPLTVTWKPSGNLLRDRIAEVCINTLRQCMHEHYEDCPWREQALYTLDSRNQMLCGYAAFGETAFPRACLELISHGQREDGLLSLCYPAGMDFPIPAFSLVYFLQMREYLTHAEDLDFLREKYPFLCSLMEVFLTKRQENGLIGNFTGEGHWNFYEWSEGMAGNLGAIDEPAQEAPLNAFLSLALQELATIAEVLGNQNDVAFYRARAQEVNEALATAFYNTEACLFESFSNRRHGEYSVLTNSLCLLCGAADGLDTSVILTILASNGDGGCGRTVIPNTLSMNGFRFDALLKEDRATYGPIILDELDRTYLAMLEQGATSFWETAKGEADFSGSGSLCHGWSALPIYYYETLS